ncbi:hypothetical protein GIB67_028410, partial [Kingdonia uniflora]
MVFGAEIVIVVAGLCAVFLRPLLMRYMVEMGEAMRSQPQVSALTIIHLLDLVNIRLHGTFMA